MAAPGNRLEKRFYMPKMSSISALSVILFAFLFSTYDVYSAKIVRVQFTNPSGPTQIKIYDSSLSINLSLYSFDNKTLQTTNNLPFEVSVTCYQRDQSPLYSLFLFPSTPIVTQASSVSFFPAPRQAGRPALISCSVAPSNPSDPSLAVDYVFTDASSTYVSIQVLPAARLSFAQTSINLTRDSAISYGFFDVYLSEAVDEDGAIIKCASNATIPPGFITTRSTTTTTTTTTATTTTTQTTQTTQTTPTTTQPTTLTTTYLPTGQQTTISYNDTGQLYVDFSQSSVAISRGTTKTTIQYNILQLGDPVAITCYAESSGTSKQYLKIYAVDTAVMQVVNLTASIKPSMISTRGLAAEAYIVLSSKLPKGTSGVRFQCALQYFDSRSTAHVSFNKSVCPDFDSQATTTTRSPRTLNGTTSSDLELLTSLNCTGAIWSLVKSDFQFTEVDLSSAIKMKRNCPSTSNVFEYLVVTCCQPKGQSGFSGVINIPFALFVENQADAVLPFQLNKTRADLAGFNVTNPASTEVSPCSCDVTDSKCDINCCCDGDCDGKVIASFNCITGIRGGVRPDAAPYWNCNHNSYANREDWFPFLCIQTNNTAHLGLYFSAKKLDFPQTEKDFTERFGTVLQTQSGFMTRANTNPVTAAGYKYGDALWTEMEEPNLMGYLTLPQRSLDGICGLNTPLNYMVNVDSTCAVTNLDSVCSSDLSLNAQSYILSPQLFSSFRKSIVRILKTPTRINSGGVFISTEVNYYCLTTDQLSQYIKQPAVSGAASRNQSTVFDYQLQIGTFLRVEEIPCAVGTSCENKTASLTIPYQDWDYRVSDLDLANRDEVTSPQWQRCSFDNGLTAPSTPTFNSTKRKCLNAVVGVNYQLRWSGTTLVAFTADVLLADIPSEQQTSGLKTQLLQSFSAKFLYMPNKTTTATTTPKSGVSGYEFGSSLLSAKKIPVATKPNQTEPFLLDRRDRTTVKVFRPDYSSLCANVGEQAITFGDDIDSSCLVVLTAPDLKNCTYLRKLLFHRLQRLMPATHIAKVGDPNDTNSDDWVPIVLRSDITDLITKDWNFTKFFVWNGKQQVNIADMGDICPNLPLGIHLRIFYESAGVAEQKPLYQIVGAKIDYTMRGLKLDTNPIQSSKVLISSIRSTVQFIPIRVYQRIPNYVPYGCDDPLCWSEIFYPFTKKYHGDPQTYTIGVGLSILFFAVGLLCISYPWW